MTYTEHTTFTDINVVQYMAEMEEYMMHLVRDMASLHGDEYAAISALPMELLPQKDHYKPAPQIDAFEDPTVDTEEELIIDKAELYKKVVKSLEKEADKQRSLGFGVGV